MGQEEILTEIGHSVVGYISKLQSPPMRWDLPPVSGSISSCEASYKTPASNVSPLKPLECGIAWGRAPCERRFATTTAATTSNTAAAATPPPMSTSSFTLLATPVRDEFSNRKFASDWEEWSPVSPTLADGADPAMDADDETEFELSASVEQSP